MKKMPCLFVRVFDVPRKGMFEITREVTPGCEWVFDDVGHSGLYTSVATVKFDGTSCLVRNGILYKRYDLKKNKKTGERPEPPYGWEACEEAPDPITGHWPGWMPVDTEPESKWHRAAVEQFGMPTLDGTYELVGPKINGNPERLSEHRLVRHGAALAAPDSDQGPLVRTFDGLKAFLSGPVNPRLDTPEIHAKQFFLHGLRYIEGIVFHALDGRMCKIRRDDFGLPWPAVQPERT